MTTLEQRLSEALQAGASSIRPAQDLFARVTASIEDDRRRRRLMLRGAAVAGSIAASLFSLGLGMSNYS
ncbi:MAG: hypothetical protein WEA76_11110, partial [Acidimicrobiia bacterium]